MWKRESLKLEREREIWFKSWAKVGFKLCLYLTSFKKVESHSGRLVLHV